MNLVIYCLLNNTLMELCSHVMAYLICLIRIYWQSEVYFMMGYDKMSSEVLPGEVAFDLLPIYSTLKGVLSFWLHICVSSMIY